ncbi:MAG: HNH endonuclease [Candidatus Nanoarchaeia archaeon]
MKNIEPLPIYKEPILYTGLATVGSIGYLIYVVIYGNSSSDIVVPLTVVATIFGFFTYLMYDSRCPECKRPFSKKERSEWREDLGVKKEPFTYYAKKYQYNDGTTEPVPGSKKTIMRPRKYDRHYYVCKTCEHGINKDWPEVKSKWLGDEPRVKYIKKKGSAGDLGVNLIGESSYTYEGKRRTIPKKVKQDLWFRCFGPKKAEGNCKVCDDKIHFYDFEVGHIKARARGGTDNLNNLMPICSRCNKSMGTQHMKKYKRRYY